MNDVKIGDRNCDICEKLNDEDCKTDGPVCKDWEEASWHRGERAENSLDFYQRRCDLLQKQQRHMRDPERTLVCDILANGELLPDPNGERYGKRDD